MSKSRYRGRTLTLEFLLSSVAAWVMLGLTSTAVCLAGPAADEYTLDFPDAMGKKEATGKEPQSRPQGVPPAVRDRLAHSRDGEALEAIATARGYGAPNRSGSSRAEPPKRGDEAAKTPSAVVATTGSADDPALIGLLLALGVLGGAFLLIRRRGARPSS